MIAETRLSDAHLSVICDEVFSRLFGESDDARQKAISRVTETKSLTATIDALILDGKLDSSAKKKLSLTGLLYRLSDHSVFILAFCLAQSQVAGIAEGTLEGEEEVAERVILIGADASEIPAEHGAAWTKLRQRLFGRAATAVICCLITKGVIPVQNANKDAVVSFLRSAREFHGHDIARDSMWPLVQARADGDTVWKTAGISSDQQNSVTTFLLRLQRLAALVKEPEDIGPLIRCGCFSAEAISRDESVVTTLCQANVPDERARKISQHAKTIASRNEYLTLEALKARGTGGKKEVALKFVQPTQTSADGEVNLSTIFELAGMGCEDCNSITGPAAFLVDIMHSLRGENIDDTTLLDKLFERRADLGNLELSCANTEVLIPYVDLVNEVLESVVWNLETGNQTLIPPFDMDQNDTSDKCIEQPQHTNFQVYSQYVQGMVAPMSVFPYNQATHTTRTLLTVLGVSRRQLLDAFKPPFSITNQPPVSDMGLTVAWDRARVAEVLNLQFEDYVAITREGFYEPMQAAGRDQSDYNGEIGLKPISQYWGYDSESDMCSDSGLTMLQAELLPRTSLSLPDLLVVLETKFFAGCLAIAIPPTDDDPTEFLAGMRLKEYVAGEPSLPTEWTCYRLQAFLRLQRKIQWPFGELDAVMDTIATDHPPTTDPRLLKALAAVNELAEILGLSPTQLQPFWGSINTRGSDSLYTTLFLNQRLSDSDRAAFTPDDDGVLPTGNELDSYVRIVCMVLNISPMEYTAMKEVLGHMPDLTIENLSRLYRVSVFCKAMGFSPLDYVRFLELDSSFRDVFRSPSYTLTAVRKYPPLQEISKDWTLGQLAFAVHGIPSPNDEGCDLNLDGCLEIITSIKSNSAGRGSGQGVVFPVSFHVTVSPAARQIVLNSLRSYFPCLDMAALLLALAQSPRDSTRSYMTMLLDLTLPETNSPPFQGYFRPPSTDTYHILRTSAQAPVDLTLDGNRIKFDDTAAITDTLVGGRWYPITYDGTITDLTWYTSQAGNASARNFDETVVLDGQTVSDCRSAAIWLMRISLLVGKYNLDLLELERWLVFRLGEEANTGSVFSDTLRLDDIQTLEQYLTLKIEFANHTPTPLPLLSFYKWLLSSDKKGESLASQISLVSGWSEKTCGDFLDAKYPDCSEEQRIARMQSVSSLFEMRESIRFVDSAGLQSVSFQTLFGIAQPRYQDIVAGDFQDAAAIRAGAQSGRPLGASNGDPTSLSTAFDILRDGQREALINYLLSMQYAKDRQLSTPDELFAYFLIDVQMGSGLQTSRLKQAISTVQLFIRRCSLGLEGSESQDTIMQLDLDYLLRYRLWEANRKAFLYPENWLDPSLRDDKTEEFRALESATMQAKLNSDSIADLIKDYLHDASAMANLRVEAYLIEPRPDYGYDVMHIFARLRTSPPVYYYRTVQIPTDSYLIPMWTPLWGPWSQLPADIAVLTTDAAGKKLRQPGSYLLPALHEGSLYIFIPQVMLWQQASDASSNGTTVGHNQPGKPQHPSEAAARSKSDDPDPGKPPDSFWQIQMGFIRLRNGKWSPKSVCESCLHVQAVTGHGTDAVPNNSNFKFWLRPTDDTSVPPIIDVEWVLDTTDSPAPDFLGTFEIRDQQLVLVDDETNVTSMKVAESRLGQAVFDEAATTTILTEFGKFKTVQSTADNPDLVIDYNGKDVEVQLGYSDWKQKRTTQWTLDFNFPVGGYISGLFQETSNKTSVKTFVDLDLLHEFDVKQFFNEFAPRLLESAENTPGLQSLFDCLRAFTSTEHVDAFGKWFDLFSQNAARYHEGAVPFAVYNWEVGVHIPALLIEQLMSTQQYEMALNLTRLVFDPRAPSHYGKDAVTRCWSFPPFREDCVRKATISQVTSNNSFSEDEFRESTGNVHAAARANPVAYMKRIAFKYIECLLAMGDDYFRQDTLESIPFAIQMYTEASQVLGPLPLEVPELGPRPVRTYLDIEQGLDNFSNAQVDMEVDFPFYVDPESRGEQGVTAPPLPLTLKTPYFSFPRNPYLLSLRDLIDDRLYKIRSGMDINGTKRRLPLFEPPIDPGALVRAVGGGGPGIAGLLGDLDGPIPRYRFTYLLQRAYELAEELKRSGQKLQGIKRSKDTEALAQLRLDHQSSVMGLAVRVKNNACSELQSAMTQLQAQRKQQEMILQYYLKLTGDQVDIPEPGATWQDIEQEIKPRTTDDLRLSPEEAEEEDRLGRLFVPLAAEAAAKMSANLLKAMPKIVTATLPMGLGCETEIPTRVFAHIAEATADGLGATKEAGAMLAEAAKRKGVAKEQLQDRRLKANTAGWELMKIDSQIQQATARLATNNASIQSHQTEINNALAEQEWLRTKYTNEDLYNVFDASLSTLFHRTYLMASDLVKMVQRALEFEFAGRGLVTAAAAGDPTTSINGYWENSRDGQLSGETIYLELKRLENLWLQNSTHDFEIRKAISLRELDPTALLLLRETGQASFNIPETIFDMDFPGQLCRRIGSMAVSVICEPPVPSSIACTVQLSAHNYRRSFDGGNYTPPDDASIRSDQIPITSIAVSRCAADSGILDLQFRDKNQYCPFEGAGVISTWKIILPDAIRRFDYDRISDIVFELGYTATDGGTSVQRAAEAAVKDTLQGHGETGPEQSPVPFYTAVDLQEYLSTTDSAITVPDFVTRFPYWAQGGDISNQCVSVYVKPPQQDLSITVNDIPLGEEQSVGQFTVVHAAGIQSSKDWVIDNIGNLGLTSAWLVVEFTVTLKYTWHSSGRYPIQTLT